MDQLIAASISRLSIAFTGCIDTVDMKNVLGEINTNRVNRRSGWLLWLVGFDNTTLFGT
jgi:hypothetical protein